MSPKNFLVHVLAPLSSNPSSVPACPKTFQWILKKLDNSWCADRMDYYQGFGKKLKIFGFFLEIFWS